MWINGKWVGPVMEGAGTGTGDGGGGTPSWRDSLPQDLRASASLQKFSDVSALAKSYTELESLQGSSIRIPGPEAGADARKQFIDKLQGKVPELVLVPADQTKLEEVEGHLYQRLGRPADEKGYALPKDLPVESKLEPDVEQRLRVAAKGLGLTQKQFEGFVKAHVGEVLEAQKSLRTAQAVLDAKWGAAKDERVAAAVETAVKLGVPAEVAKAMHPSQLETWWNVAQAISGDGGGEGRRQGAGPGAPKLDPSEAKRRAAEIRERKEYWDNNSPLQKALVEEHNNLMKLAYPT